MSAESKPAEIRELDRAGTTFQHVRRFFCLEWKHVSELLTETFDQWSADNVPRLGAALAYYSVFSLAPLLIVVIAVAGLAFGREIAQKQIFDQIQDFIGAQGAKAVEAMIQAARSPAKGVFATAVGLVTLIFGASAVVSELRSSLNLIWKAPQPAGSSGVLRGIVLMLRQRFLSFAMVLGVGFLLLISLVINAVMAALGQRFQQLFPVPEFAFQAITVIVWFALTSFLFALIYKVMPDIEIAWSDVAVGAIVTSALFTLGKFLISLYLGKSSVTSAYGAAGSLVVILLWVYYSAQIFFFGAEFTRTYANKFGSRLRARLSVKPSNLSSSTCSSPIIKAS